MAKNIYISMILSFFITGLGNVYNGLVSRGFIELVIGIVISLLGIYIYSVIGYLGTLWWIYVLYDTYVCTNAINNNQAIPKFLTQFDLE